jgi:hypothetical protein
MAVVVPTWMLRKVSSGSDLPRKSGTNSTAMSVSAMTPRKSFACAAETANGDPAEARLK